MNTKTRNSDTDLPTPLSAGSKRGTGSILVDETFHMEKRRRLDEQQGQRQFARVHAREHEEPQVSAHQEEVQDNLPQHPWLDSQRLDGIDRTLIPPDLRRELDNLRREQELEKQYRLGLMPQMKSAPEPKP